MRNGLACCADDDVLQADLSIAENTDVSAGQPSLCAQRRANVGAIDENGNGRLAGATETIGARDVPLFDLIGNLGQPVT